jgi:hypothetical protein
MGPAWPFSFERLSMATTEPIRIPDERLSIEKRGDGALVVRVQSEGPADSRLPDAVFSFRCGDPQYTYWLGRLRSLDKAR